MFGNSLARQIPSSDSFSPSNQNLLQLKVDDSVVLQSWEKLQEKRLVFSKYFATEVGSNCNLPFLHKYLSINLNKGGLNEIGRANIGVL